MKDKQMLMIPGPTSVPEEALLTSAKHPIGHRSSEFSEIMMEVTQNLKWLHQTENDVLMVTGSGTAAMEAAMINFLSPGDRILVGCNGKFGNRWAEVGKIFGLNVETITAPWGKPLDTEIFSQKLQADIDRQIQAVIITHNETSTGVINDLGSINYSVKAHGKALIIVDAITSLGVVNIPVDAWGLDVVVSASQKGYMVPPGLGFVSVSSKAWKAYEIANLPKYYLDLNKYRQFANQNTTPFTPPINLIMALQVSLRMMRKEGLSSIFAHHQRLMSAIRAGLKALNLTLFAEDKWASPSVTAFAPSAPSKLSVEEIRTLMSEHFNIILAGGQDHLKSQILRIGHLGFICDRDIITFIAALEVVLSELGWDKFSPGDAISDVSTKLKEKDY